ncbi:hypothetical protein ACTXT7_013433 [Hymenolepis weldensis]
MSPGPYFQLHTSHRLKAFTYLLALSYTTLLDLGQNPNCRDWRGLTPLYYAVSTDISARCTHALLYDHAIIGIEDEHGFQEIHQACKANRTQHLENLIAYGADLNARTRRGQTPLHICVWHESDACLRQLLLRGANPTEVNEDNQTPLEYALLTNRNEQAAILQNFDPASVVVIRDPPSYNTSRRPTVNGPRGAVAYNYLHKSSLSNADCASICTGVLSPSESLFSTDRLSIHTTGSPLSTNGASDDVLLNSINSVFSHATEDYSKSFGGTPKARRANFGEEKQRKTSVPSRIDRGQEKSYTRTIAMRRGRDGFGFTLNGIPRKALIRHGRQPLLNTPSNQYFSLVVPGGPADRAGIREGDYVIEIDGQDITDACHEDTVECIKNCGDSLIMRVTTVYRDSNLRQLNVWTALPQFNAKLRASKGKRHIIIAPLLLLSIDVLTNLIIIGNGQISNSSNRLHLPNETNETSETSSSIGGSSASEDEVIHTNPTLSISATKPPLESVVRNPRGRMLIPIEERSRRRERQRTLSSGQINERIRLHSSLPPTRTKERVFVFEEINGKGNISKFKAAQNTVRRMILACTADDK